MEIWMKKYVVVRNKCDTSLSSIQHNKTTVNASLGLYVVLLCGISLSFTSFLVEIVYYTKIYLP